MTLPAPNVAFHWSDEPWGPALRCTALERDAQHLFTSRQLPLRESPATAWRDAAASIGAGPDHVARIRQVHGRTVHVIREGSAPARVGGEMPEADAVVSNHPGLVLAVQVADCVPILLADRRRGVAAAVHAGWRGTRAGIAAAAVEAMTHAFGSDPADVAAAIGPSIGACCYEVGDEVFESFRSAADERSLAAWFTRSDIGSLRLDLWAANREQLRSAGLREARVFAARLCTQTHVEVFHSYRVAGPSAGRMAALIRVPAASPDAAPLPA
jgi:polyphenol oxidase